MAPVQISNQKQGVNHSNTLNPGIKKFKRKKSKTKDSIRNHSNKKLTSDDWAHRLKKHFDNLSRGEQELLKSYWPFILKGISRAVRYDNLDKLERFEELKESFEYALLIQGAEYFMREKPERKSVSFWAMKHTLRRKQSWYLSQIRQRENIQTIADDFILVKDEEDEITEIGLPESNWEPTLKLLDPSNLTPEEYLIALENYHKIKQFLHEAWSLKIRKHTKLYLQILEMILSGVEVLPKHAVLFGIPKEKMASFKNQAINWMMEIIGQEDEEIFKKQEIFRAQKKKKWRIEKSTFQQRRELHQDPYYEKPHLIRHWKIIKGNGQGKPTLSQDINSLIPNDPIAA